VINVPLAYAFTAGLVAAVNPCGFPMLPAYLSWFIGTDDDTDTDTGARVLRALGSALAVSIGFVAVFAGLGIPINAGASSIYRWMPWLTMVIATRHPSPGAPIMFAAATRAPSKLTCPNSVVMPLIILSGRCSIPG